MKEETKKKITDLIEANPICLFMKGTPEVPQCGFSMAVSNVLKHLSVKFTGVNVLEDPEIRIKLSEYSDQPTIPQRFVKGELIGGCDIAMELHNNGELKEIFEKVE